MLAYEIIDVIERRHAEFRERCPSPSTPNLSEADAINLRIAAEYDSLIAEIEAVCRANWRSHRRVPANREDLGDRSEEWILGDQGQLGG